jgi:hypothetical protein
VQNDARTCGYSGTLLTRKMFFVLFAQMALFLALLSTVSKRSPMIERIAPIRFRFRRCAEGCRDTLGYAAARPRP